MATNNKNTSKANNNTTKNAQSVVLSNVTFAAAKEYKTNQGLSFSQTIKNLCAPYAPANKNFDPDTLKLYGIDNDSSINCFRAILIDESGKYKIYRALDKYTTTKGTAAKLLKAFEAFTQSHDFTNICTDQKNALLQALRDEAAKEEAAKELEKKEKAAKKEAAKVEKTIKSLENVDTATLEALQEFIKTRLAQ